MRRERREAAAALRRFSRFHKAFVSSDAARAALEQGFLSVQQPGRALRSVYAQQVAKAEEEKARRRRALTEGVPESLLLVLEKQKPDGKWPEDDPELEAVLGSGHGVPEPPEDIARARWTVALCMAFLRRWHDFHDLCAEPYERGRFHLGDVALLDKAKEQLPPDNLSAELDPELVRQGKWREALSHTFDRRGYEAFRPAGTCEEEGGPSSQLGEQRKRQNGFGSDATRRGTGLQDGELEHTLWRANALRSMGLARLRVSEAVDFKGGRLTATLNATAPLEQSLPLFSKLADRLAQENAAAFDDLVDGGRTEDSHGADEKASAAQENENQGCFKTAEPKRFSQKPSLVQMAELDTQEALQGLMMQRDAEPEQFIDSIAKHEALLDQEFAILNHREGLGQIRTCQVLLDRWKEPLGKKDESKRLVKATEPVPKPEWNAFRKSFARKQRKPQVRRSPRKVLVGDEEARRQEILRRVQSEAAARPRTVLLVESKDGTLEEKMRLERLKDGSNRKLHTALARVMAYEKLVSQLEEEVQRGSQAYRDSVTHNDRNHAFDTTTSLIEKTRLATCAVTEALCAWRKARNEMEQALNPSHEHEEYALTWNGANVLLKMESRLNFLSRSKELKEWFNDDLPLLDNPFMIAVPLRERPASPRQATRRVLVDGKPMLRVFRDLAQLREKEVAEMEQAWRRIDAGPHWWPRCSNELWIRVRVSEKVILEEQGRQRAFQGRLLGVGD